MDGKKILGLIILLGLILFFISSVKASMENPAILDDAEPFNGTHVEYPKNVIEASKVSPLCTGDVNDCEPYDGRYIDPIGYEII